MNNAPVDVKKLAKEFADLWIKASEGRTTKEALIQHFESALRSAIAATYKDAAKIAEECESKSFCSIKNLKDKLKASEHISAIAAAIREKAAGL